MILFGLKPVVKVLPAQINCTFVFPKETHSNVMQRWVYYSDCLIKLL